MREFRPDDWGAVWQMLEPVFRAGETYVYSPDITEDEARRVWIDAPAATFVATIDGDTVGTYYLKPNQPGLGNHICNCGYVVSPAARGKGVATAMCEHSQQTAVQMGFRAMQYNLVVSTNEGAVRLWQKLGFEIVGRIPEAFRHPQQSFVDALVMYRKLVSD
ncbi:GNAT family N-acetyltransferase [Maioricimonas sp. JC845]|uniref:GNAT family N-acetyltransferase n=1 Tax=Maioricimonas sp. JC845 TaxID=3232138 RepID=UPI00345AB110